MTCLWISLSLRRIRAAAVVVAVVTVGPAVVSTECMSADTDSSVPFLDLDDQVWRQVVVDREAGQYIGHPTTVLLEDGRTMLCVYPKGHGRGPIVYKRSHDGGLTWSERLPTPPSWATSKETPTLHRVVDADGKKRIVMFSGLYPCRMAVTEDDGNSWSELEPVGDWGGIVTMGCVVDLKTGPGHYMAMFHDDGRFFTEDAKQKNPVEFKMFSTMSVNGGLTWSFPEVVDESTSHHICEPGVIRSPDGTLLGVLLRENSRRHNSQIIFSDDEGRSWTQHHDLPTTLNGDRHTGKYLPDGRLFVSFRSRQPKGAAATKHEGDWVAWVGTWDDLVNGGQGQYVVRLKDNKRGADCAYPGVEVLPDGTIVTTTYGHWSTDQPPYVISVRLKLSELDQLAKKTTADGSYRVLR
ncbi:MAG: sialidase family protein [Planctomycetaceae bacterium]